MEQGMNSQQRIILIMAGGAGTRFWPASREEQPKQFLDILGTGRSLLRQTFDRCAKITAPEQIFILTNKRYAERVRKELPELTAEQVFLEPSRNNTAPCVAFASLKIQLKYPDAVCLVAPSDHLIDDENEFVEIVEHGMEYASATGALVTLGITPSRPDTGYGYVHYDRSAEKDGVYPVKQFTEKPDLEAAKQFIASGDYLWNSGMFIWTVGAILNAFDLHAKHITDLLRKGEAQYFTEAEEAFLAEYYPQTEKISIDYAILERSDNVAVIPADFGWSDLGTWTSLYDHVQPDADGNITIHAPVILDQCQGTLVHTDDHKLVVAAGLKDVVIVMEDDVVLIFPRDREQEVKVLREKAMKGGLKKYL